jgi:serine/threonine protein kinase
MTTYTSPNHVLYFYGRLLRNESEKILKKHGASNGLFLLRERLEETGSFVISVCFDKNIGHYKIDRQPDGTVRIDKGKKFIGPIELVKYHETEDDGLVTKLIRPCNRSAKIEPIYYLFVYNSEFHQGVEKEIKNKCRTQEELKDARGRFRFKYEQEVAKKIHFSQNWFFKNLDRDQAVKLLNKSGPQDGKFLVRFKDHYKISVCYRKEIKHYEINSHDNKFSLEGGKEFETIIQLIDYYHRCNDGLLVKLLIPYTPHVRTIEVDTTDSNNSEYSIIDNVYESNESLTNLLDDNYVLTHQYVDDEPLNQNDVSDLKNIPPSKRSLFQDEDNYRYDFMPKCLTFEDIELYDELGRGNFGVVNRGTYFIRNDSGEIIFELPVAVKSLNVENEEYMEEFLKEAETMISLRHENIIKLTGVCYCFKIDYIFKFL